jgi:hypothetical protein
MWEPRHLTTLWAFAACYKDSFTFFTFTNVRLERVNLLSMFPSEVTDTNSYNWRQSEMTSSILQSSALRLRTVGKWVVKSYSYCLHLQGRNIITPCSLVGGYQHFGGRYCLHLQGRNVITPYSLVGGCYRLQEHTASFRPKCWYSPTRPHGFITQKTAMITSNLMDWFQFCLTLSFLYVHIIYRPRK